MTRAAWLPPRQARIVILHPFIMLRIALMHVYRPWIPGGDAKADRSAHLCRLSHNHIWPHQLALLSVT